MMNKAYGGVVEKKDVREDGQSTVDIDTTCDIFRYEDLSGQCSTLLAKNSLHESNPMVLPKLL